VYRGSHTWASQATFALNNSRYMQHTATALRRKDPPCLQHSSWKMRILFQRHARLPTNQQQRPLLAYERVNCHTIAPAGLCQPSRNTRSCILCPCNTST
jgi:hypothetical protein